nr:sulfotransferase [Paraburkholderia sp. RAU2J]
MFVVGSPRSGTTFPCGVLNVHPLIQLANECRVFALLKDTLEVGSNRSICDPHRGGRRRQTAGACRKSRDPSGVCGCVNLACLRIGRHQQHLPRTLAPPPARKPESVHTSHPPVARIVGRS